MARTRMTMVAAFGVMWIGAELAAQTCGWRWVNPNLPRIDLRSAAVASGRIVAVGDRGLAAYSGDGSRWTLADTGVESELVAVARGGGRFAAVGDDLIVTSPDGVAWIAMDGTGWHLTDVAYGASWFVAVGTAGLDGQVVRSSNGAAWEPISAPWTGSARAVGADADTIAVLADDEVWTTPDSVVWTSLGRLPEASFGYEGENRLARDDVLVDGSTVLVARGADLYRSTQGGEFSSVLTLAPGCERFSSYVGLWKDGNRLVASGFEACPPLLDPTAQVFISTDDGVTWTLRVTEIGGGFPAMARTGGTAVALGARGDLMVGITAEGWTCAGGGCTSGACEDAFLDVVPAGNGLIAVGGVGLCDRLPKRLAGGTRAVSSAGLEWTVTPIAEAARIHDLAVHDDLLVAVGDSWIGRSTDLGATWQEAPVTAVPKMHSVAWAGDRFATVGVGGLLMTSDAGEVWSTVFTPTDADLYRIEWFDDLTWMLGADGTLLSSPDLLFWDPVSVPVAEALYGIARPDWGWVIVGAEAALATSADGVAWTVPVTGLDSDIDLHDAVAEGDVVVAVGGVDGDDAEPARGVVVASSDGAVWTRWSVRGGVLQTAIRAGGGIVAVGGDRSLLWSPCRADLVEFASADLVVSAGATEGLEVGIGRPAPSPLRLRLSASPAGAVEVPAEVVLAAGERWVRVPVRGVEPDAVAVVTVTLPEEVGSGAADARVRVRAGVAVRRASGRRGGP
jgi:hypothetical protein